MKLSRRVSMAAIMWLAAATPSWSQQWKEYRAPWAGYRVELPDGKWEYSIDTIRTNGGPAQMYTVKVQTGDGVYGASHYSHVMQFPDPQAALDTIRSHGGGELREEQRLTINGAPARRFIKDNRPMKAVVVALVVLAPGRYHHVIYAGPVGTEHSPAVRRLLDSFALLPR